MTLATKVETTQATIPANNLPALREQIAKVNRKAKRLGCAPVSLVLGEPIVADKLQRVRTEQGESFRKIRVNCYPCTVSGTAPILAGGWTLCARVQLVRADDGSTVSITHRVPGETIPSSLGNPGNRCDHCQTHRYRNDVFIVRSQAGECNRQGEHRVIGRTCVSDFLGGVTPAQLAWYAEALACLDFTGFESYQGEGQGASRDLDVERFLTASAAAIRVFGWASKKRAEIERVIATVTVASEIYESGRFAGQTIGLTEQDEQDAAKAIAWAETLGETENDYLANVHKVAGLSFMPRNLAGIAASIIPAHQREQGRRVAQGVSRHVGDQGERITARVTVLRTHQFSGSYGVTTVHTMRDDQGNVFVWFASRETPIASMGGTVNLIGTVKRHSEYRGTKQTELTRCKLAA